LEPPEVEQTQVVEITPMLVHASKLPLLMRSVMTLKQ
jgi:hypothetical protein